MNLSQFELLRKEMVSKQLASRSIKDKKTLDAFEKVPREVFVPDNLKQYAYQDRPLSIGLGQTISQPYIVALMTELLKVKPGEKILEVGTGSGYQAAILLGMGAKVYGIERHQALGRSAKEKVNLLGYDLEVKIGDGTLGWEEFSPYDKMIVTAASPKVPETLVKQLKIGGRIVLPLGPQSTQQLTVVDKTAGDKFKTTAICGCVFVPLVGKEGWSE